MSLTKPIPVRLDENLIARLDSAAHRMGSNRAAVIRFLVKTFIDEFERRGFASLPHNWRDLMHDYDGRTLGQRKWQKTSLLAAETANSIPIPELRAVTYLKGRKKTKPNDPKSQ